jgi:hypothetical protein
MDKEDIDFFGKQLQQLMESFAEYIDKKKCCDYFVKGEVLSLVTEFFVNSIFSLTTDIEKIMKENFSDDDAKEVTVDIWNFVVNNLSVAISISASMQEFDFNKINSIRYVKGLKQVDYYAGDKITNVFVHDD